MLTDAEGRDIVERIRALADCAYWTKCGWDIPGDSTQVIGRLAVKAADAIEQYRAAWLHAAGQAAASVPEPTTGFHLTMSEGLSRFTHHGPLTTSKFDDVFSLLYAAPAVAQEEKS